MVLTGASAHAQVSFPMDQVDPFQCADRELQAAYKHRHLRAAFCNVQHPKNQAAVTTKARFGICCTV